MKLQVYNLIILDESGSMSCIKSQTISGCNETLNTIRSAQQTYPDTQEHFVSIYAFQSNPNVKSRYLIHNMPIDAVSDINGEVYSPWGSTPLYDAVGETLTDLKAEVDKHDMAIGSVTIITDGMENASRRYTHNQVAEMIKALKEKGWSFNFIGANIDVERVARDLHIENALRFEQSDEGTQAMFARERKARKAYYEKLELCCDADACEDEEIRIQRCKEASKDYFNEE